MSKARDLADLGAVTSRLDTVGASDGALSNRNMVINGGMVIDQRNNGSSITPTAWAYSVDRFRAEIGQPSKITVEQNAGSVTPPNGFSHYLGVTSTSAYTPLTGDYFYINTQIEGYNSAQLGWGASGAKDATLSFWVRSSLTGTHSGALRNGNSTRSYPFTFTVSSSNTWEYITIIVSGDTSGTWATDNTSGIQLSFSLGGGTTYRGTAGAWASADYRAGVTGAVDIVGTNGATLYLTGVQLEVGDTATPFEHRSYGDELARCKRYYESSNRNITNDANTDRIAYLSYSTYSTSEAYCTYYYEVEKRAQPTITHGSSNWRIYQNAALISTSGAGNSDGIGIRNFSLYLTGPTFDVSEGGMADYRQFDGIKIDAEL